MKAWPLIPLLLAPAPAWSAEQKALFVTSDTEAYCDHLSYVASQHKRPSREAQLLAHDGAELCAHGAVRAGIARLRRALLIMRAEERSRPK